MGGLDAPRLRIEVVGAIADVLDGSEWNAFIGDGDDPTRGIGRQHEGFTTQISQSLGVGEVNAWEFALGKVCLKDFEFRIKS